MLSQKARFLPFSWLNSIPPYRCVFHIIYLLTDIYLFLYLGCCEQQIHCFFVSGDASCPQFWVFTFLITLRHTGSSGTLVPLQKSQLRKLLSSSPQVSCFRLRCHPSCHLPSLPPCLKEVSGPHLHDPLTGAELPSCCFPVLPTRLRALRPP